MSKRHNGWLLPALLVFVGGVSAVSAQVGGQASKSAATPVPRPAPPPPPAVPAPAGPSAAELGAPPAAAAKLPSGVATRQLRAGDGKAHASAADIVQFRAIGRRPDGTVVQDGFGAKPASQAPLAKLSPAWQEILIGMTVGEQRRVWFPAAMMPVDKTTGKQEPVVFDVQLERIVDLPAAPASLRAPDPKAKKVNDRASVLVVKKGDGAKLATRTDGALCNFTAWNAEGAVVGSSVMDGRPTLFPLDRVMPAFADCIEGMSVGEHRQCWIPALHNDGFPNAPKGDLVFDIELLSFLDLAQLQGAKIQPQSH